MKPNQFDQFFNQAEKHPAYKKELAVLKSARKKRGRPALPKSSRRVSLTVRLSQPIARILKERARSADMPVSRLMEMMVRETVVDQLYFRGKK